MNTINNLKGQEPRLIAADFAEHVLPLFEAEYPDDDRPRKSIEAARSFARGEITKEQLAAAWSAAWAAAEDAERAAAGASARGAARAAAWSAAWAAARDAAKDAAWAAAWAAERGVAGGAARAAAWDAERAWQQQRIDEVVEERAKR